MKKILQLIHKRLTKAFFQRLCLRELQVVASLLGLYALLYLPIGFYSGFLKLEIQTKWTTWIVVLISTLIMPALNEEILFRVLIIPHPSEQVVNQKRWLAIVVSWILFLIYHPLNPFGKPFFSKPVFLTGAGLLGICCTVTYLRSGSLWFSVVIHWLIVSVWMLLFGGLEKVT